MIFSMSNTHWALFSIHTESLAEIPPIISRDLRFSWTQDKASCLPPIIVSFLVENNQLGLIF